MHRYVNYRTGDNGTEVVETRVFGECGKFVSHDIERTTKGEGSCVSETCILDEKGNTVSVEVSTERWVVDENGKRHPTGTVIVRDGRIVIECIHEYPGRDFNAERTVKRDYVLDGRLETESIPEYWDE